MHSLSLFDYRVAFAKVWYDIYDSEREHVASVLLRKSHLRGKIQHRVPEFEIISSDGTTNIGRINPFSTDLERSEYGQAVSVKGETLTADECFSSSSSVLQFRTI